MSLSGGGGEGDAPPRNSKNLKEKVGLCVWKKNEKKWKMDDHGSGYHITILLFVAVSSFDEKRDCL